MSEHTLQFPKAIAEEIGLHECEINGFKGQGCRFFGRKTSIIWVREFLNKITDPNPTKEEEPSSGPSEHHQRSAGSKSGARGRKNG